MTKQTYDLAQLGPPAIDGQAAAAWIGAPTDEERARWPAGLDTWLVYCPSAHPLWSWYVVTSCSLRDFPGMGPALKLRAINTHELIVYALDPDWQPTPEWGSSKPGRWHFRRLDPANLGWQAAAETSESDAQWCQLVRALVEAFCEGSVSPDTDHRRSQLALLERTLQALRTAS